MRFIHVFQAVICFLIAGLAGDAAAEATEKYIWGPPSTKLVQPMLEGEKDFAASPWADKDWNPQGWIDSRGGSAKAVIDGFYSAGIVTDQYMDDNIPVLEVGQKFLELSKEDKHRVSAFIDEAFGVTKQKGVFMIYFNKYDVPVGLFTAQGLQLQ